MKRTDIFKSIETKDRYFLVPSGSDVSILPEKVEQKKWKSIDLKEGKSYFGLSGNDAIQGIKERGYYEENVAIKFNISISIRKIN